MSHPREEGRIGQENVGKAMALGMVVIVAVVMTLYIVLERRTSGGWADEPAGAATAPPGPVPARRGGGHRSFFVLPLVAMLEFTTRAPGGGRSLDTWATLLDVGAVERDYPELRPA